MYHKIKKAKPVGYSRTNQINAFENMLCDTSSIKSICNSNHTLGYLAVKLDEADMYLTTPRILSLKLNRNENKREVIQNKIMQYYFIAD